MNYFLYVVISCFLFSINPLDFPNSFKVLKQLSENTGLAENKVSCSSYWWENLILLCPTEKLNRLANRIGRGGGQQHPLPLTVAETVLGPWK